MQHLYIYDYDCKCYFWAEMNIYVDQNVNKTNTDKS